MLSTKFFLTATLLVFLFLESLGNETLDKILEKLDDDCPILHSKFLKGCPNPDGDEISFRLYTSTSQDTPYRLFLKNFRDAPFVDGPLKIWFHGYTDDYSSPIVTSVRRAYTSNGVNNVITVDWGFYCKPGCYLQATESIPNVGFCVAKFLNTLLKIHSFSYVHVLGHSLGAHVAARTTHHMQHKPDRLTKLDPAKPFFTTRSTKRGTAEFIDTYHSNAMLTGQKTPSGHVDVYFNTETFQPGCACDIGCSHTRCVEYYLESIPKTMKAFPCKGWIHYTNDKCPVPKLKDLVVVGEDIDIKRRGIYMAFTNGQPPYLKDHSEYIVPKVFRSFKEALISEECAVAQYVSVVTDWVQGKWERL